MKIAVAGGTGTVGRHVVAALTAGGHEVVILTRATGADLITGVGLAPALKEVDAVVDVTSLPTASASRSIKFFGTVTARLLAAERGAGIRHHLALSIPGAATINRAYFAGKKVQEDLVMDAGFGWTIVRATQFHEFVRQVLASGSVGPIHLVPTMLTQPIAAAEVGAALALLATRPPVGLAPDLAGPKVERMADLVRRYLRASGSRQPVAEVSLPGSWGRGMRDGSLLPRPGAGLGTQTFDEWLATI
jgi:uncharacterized protein YbjT (DUF2867 family)